MQDTSMKARKTKAKMNYWDFIKIKSFCIAIGTVNKTKRQPTEWEEMFANVIPHKGLVSKIYEELLLTWSNTYYEECQEWSLPGPFSIPRVK